MSKAKQEVSQWFGKLITQVADWETSAAKFTLIEKLLQIMLNFCHASICTSIAKEHHSENTSTKTHNIAHEVSKLILEENLLHDEAKMCEHLELPKIEVVSICIANVLEGNVDTTTTDLP